MKCGLQKKGDWSSLLEELIQGQWEFKSLSPLELRSIFHHGLELAPRQYVCYNFQILQPPNASPPGPKGSLRILSTYETLYEPFINLSVFPVRWNITVLTPDPHQLRNWAWQELRGGPREAGTGLSAGFSLPPFLRPQTHEQSEVNWPVCPTPSFYR